MTTRHPSETPDMTHKPLFGDLIAAHPGLADELKAMTTLHDEIKGIECHESPLLLPGAREAYLKGHRDARYAAAELAIASDARIEALEAEGLEQSRIIGMGAELELALMARVSGLEAALRVIDELHPHDSSTGDWNEALKMVSALLKGQP